MDFWERYPRALCPACAALATDAEGRPMRFSNESFSGGFIAEVLDGDVWRRVESGACHVHGRRCVADEHRFGGIVIQLAD